MKGTLHILRFRSDEADEKAQDIIAQEDNSYTDDNEHYDSEDEGVEPP